jgi:glycosyltransferase involved in cell wall biosynthesis
MPMLSFRAIIRWWARNVTHNLPRPPPPSAEMSLMQDRSPALIAVDLTPVLPGGDNGGAKVLTLALLRQLAARAPRAHFLLLTQAASHAELAPLDCDNISRRLVAGGGVAGPCGGALQPLARRVLSLAPPRLNAVLGRFGYEVHAALKRGGRAGLLRGLGVELLFCPFTAPSFAEPGIPTVCVVHDLQFMAFPEFFAAEDLANRTWSFRKACRRAAALVAVSDFPRAAALGAARLAPERIQTIHPRLGGRFDGGQAGETGRVSPAPGGGAGLTPDPYLLYPANFWPHKNHEMLLTAFGMARQSGLAPDLRLVCTGAPGERQRELTAAAAGMGLGKAVLFPGFLPAAAFGTLLAQARGLVFPSLYEGFGLPVIEAMALGIPVACSDMTALPEIAGDAALFFDPRIPAEMAGALIRLNHDDALRSRLTGAGRARAADFSDQEAMAAAYWRLFCSLTHGGS